MLFGLAAWSGYYNEIFVPTCGELSDVPKQSREVFGRLLKTSLALLAVFSSVLYSAQLIAAKRPNILLLMAEDLSPRIGAFGDTVARTPNIDELALGGIRYTSAFTTAGVCAPSRASIITGMYQQSIGAQHMRSRNFNKAKYAAVPPEDVKAFPEHLRAHGYFTFNTNKLDYQFSKATPKSGPFTIWDTDVAGDIEFSELPADKPFFGYMNFLGTHESGLFSRGVFPQSMAHLTGQIMQTYLHWDTEAKIQPADVEVPPYYPDTPLVRKDIAQHYNNIITVDRELGEIRQGLREAGLEDNTIIIWTTDHGDGLPRAKRSLYDSGLKVPLIIYWPESLRPDHVSPGSLENRLVSLVDLGPTILSLAGISVPANMQGLPFEGIEKAAPREYVFAASDRMNEVDDYQRAIRDKQYKYIRSYNLQASGYHLGYRDQLNIMQELWRALDAGELNEVQMQWFSPRSEEMLFDTWNDPHEINNLAAEPDSLATLVRMREAYLQFRSRVTDLSEESESVLAERFWPGGVQPQTPIPTLRLDGLQLFIKPATENDSIGYRKNSQPWLLYTKPLRLDEDDEIQAKAVRYGWSESELAELVIDKN
ncbi:MAG: N-sulfoglucosamine sulfohydrolase [Dinoroseobacter sp.]|jgi:N-sulfoglucosamine sulfohydrolase